MVQTQSLMSFFIFWDQLNTFKQLTNSANPSYHHEFNFRLHDIPICGRNIRERKREKYLKKKNHFFCGGEEKRIRKTEANIWRRKIFSCFIFL